VKILSAALLAFALAGLLRADESILENGDFSDGIHHWRGDANAAVTLKTSSNTTTSSLAVTCATVKLQSHGTTMWQEIENAKLAPDAPVDVTVNYSTSTDYAPKVSRAKPSADFPQGELFAEPVMVTLSRTTSGKLSSTGTFTGRTSGEFLGPTHIGYSGSFQKTMTVPAAKGSDLLWFKLWIPPGAGSITFTKISVTKHNGPVAKPADGASPNAGSSSTASGNPANSPQPPK
jgi:hypothetical protein